MAVEDKEKLPVGRAITADKDKLVKLWPAPDAGASKDTNVVVEMSGSKVASVKATVHVGPNGTPAQNADKTIGMPSSGADTTKATVTVPKDGWVWGARSVENQVPQLRIFQATD